jgi:hypothetical protein
LSQYDGEAIDLLAESNLLLAKALGKSIQQKIAHAAHVYNFDSALIALRTGAESAGYDLPEVILPGDDKASAS